MYGSAYTVHTHRDEGLLIQKFSRRRLPPMVVSVVVTVVTQSPTCSPAVVPHIKFINPFPCHCILFRFNATGRHYRRR